MKTLLIVWHSRSGGTRQLVDAAAQAARDVADVIVIVKPASEATADDVLAADALLFSAPENLATLSGAMKEFFDTRYYALLDRCAGKAYASIVCAGSDGSGATRQLDRIATGLRLRRIAEPLIVCTQAQTPEAILAAKRISAEDRQRAADLGSLLGNGLALGLF